MANILNSPAPNLTLNDSLPNNQVSIQVHYHVSFSALENFLANQGLRFREVIEVYEVNPPAGLPGDEFLFRFSNWFPQNSIAAGVSVHRTTPLQTFPEMQFDHLPSTNPDNIRCRIRLIPNGLPFETEALTDIEQIQASPFPGGFEP